MTGRTGSVGFHAEAGTSGRRADGACGGPTNAICAPNGVALAGPAALTFDALGRPSAAAAYAVTDGAMNLPITVEAETGYVR